MVGRVMGQKAASKLILISGVFFATYVLLPTKVDAVEAIARCSITGVVGTGQGDSLEEARDAAVQNCIYKGGIPGCCHWTNISSTVCSALAVNNSGEEFEAEGSSRDAAIGKAYRLCNAAGKPGCKVEAATLTCTQ